MNNLSITVELHTKQLTNWLSLWKEKLKSQQDAKREAGGDGKKEKGAKKGKDKDLTRAVLISGPPGIGKSTAATLVAEELGYKVLEFNASSTRNKAAVEGGR